MGSAGGRRAPSNRDQGSVFPVDEMRKPLDDRDRDLLWMASQGYSPGRMAHLRNESPEDSMQALKDIVLGMGAYNATHAVAVAIHTGLIGPGRDCGTRRAYLRHIRRRESACAACRRANADSAQEQRNRAVPTGFLTPTQMKIVRVLDADDCTYDEVAERLGISARRVASHMSEVYRRLGLTHLHRHDRRDAALVALRTRGLLENPVK